MSITRIDALAPGGAPTAAGVMGPNAITRVAEALTAALGEDACRAVFASAGAARHLTHPPTQMVDEMEVARLHRALIEILGPAQAAEISREAGRLTGDYLLANRIPVFAQIILGRLPRPIAAHMLVSAIARHAWTFAGSGEFSFCFTPGLRLRLAGSPICRQLRSEAPVCHYFAATFERVFSAVLGPVTVQETECEASGAKACIFEIRW
jgi:divinyl protochlorophyllide a 8-vinyl-reductase